MFSVWRYYRHPGAPDGRIISENDCLILQIFPMSDGETSEEVPMNVMNHQQAEREELVERIARAMRQDGTAQPLQGLHLYRHSLFELGKPIRQHSQSSFSLSFCLT